MKTKTEIEMEKLAWLEQWSDKPWIREMAREARVEHQLETEGRVSRPAYAPLES
jgi:hypothetical protein